MNACDDRGEIASTFDKPELVTLGECKLIDEIMVGEDRLIRFSGCKSGTACSIILRGASSHLLGEREETLLYEYLPFIAYCMCSFCACILSMCDVCMYGEVAKPLSSSSPHLPPSLLALL